ncbi:DsbA family protein [Pyruvatibacter mobilis]|uniref:DsbA family protein n=1 Tax=Pyruvatibacter mobilis TaxID=1712261 RepID=UPI003BAC1BAD
MSDAPIRFYFSLRSPYVWLAVEEIVREGIPVEPIPVVSFAAGTVFSDPVANPPRLAYLIEDVARIAARHDLTLIPPMDTEDWEAVHNAVEFAKQQGRGMAFTQIAARMRWTQSLDLACPDVIGAVAEAAGVDSGGAVAAMDDLSIRARMIEAYTPCIEADQVFGVPFFVFDADGQTHRYWGQDRIAMMLEDARAMGA